MVVARLINERSEALNQTLEIRGYCGSMDFKTACQVLIKQTLPAWETHDTFLGRLRHQQPPVPGQVTSLLLSLKVIQSSLQSASALDRELAQSLFLIAYESRNLFESGRALGADWPPLLDEDLERLAIAAYKIFADEPMITQPAFDERTP